MFSRSNGVGSGGPGSAGTSGGGLAGDRRRALLLALAFLVVLLVGVWHHEMWRDEWQAWMLARDTASLPELLDYLGDEGHLPGWYLILWVLGRFTRDPAAMQLAHVAVATASVYLFARFAPLPWLVKVPAAFGYFLLYEYAVIARTYALGAFALFAFCALHPHRRRHPWAVAGALVVLASSSVYGVILAGAASGMLLLEAAIRPVSADVPAWRRTGARAAFAVWVLLVVAGGTIAATYPLRRLYGLSGAAGTLPLLSPWALASTATTLAQAYLPIPDLGSDLIWSTFALPAGTRWELGSLLAVSVALFAGAVLLFLRTPGVLFFFVTGTGGLFVFTHLVFGGTIRHHGHLFLLFLAGLWLAASTTFRYRVPFRLDSWTGIGSRPARGFVLGILLAQVVAAGLLYATDLRTPFSSAPLVAERIREEGLEELPMGASPAPAASSVAGVLDRPIHYLVLEEEGTFIRWEGYPRGPDRFLTMDAMRPFLDAHPAGALVILGEPFQEWDADLEVEELARFPESLARGERYVLYRVGVAGS